MPFIVIQQRSENSYTVHQRKTLADVKAMARSRPTIRSEEIGREIICSMEIFLQKIEGTQCGACCVTGSVLFSGSYLEGASSMMLSTGLMPFKVPMGRNG